MDTLKAILFLIYIVVAYWSTGQTIYANKIIITSEGQFFARKFAIGLFFGWILIPISLIKRYLASK